MTTRRHVALCLAALITTCSSEKAAPKPQEQRISKAMPVASAKEPADDRKFVVFEGTCDTSAAVPIDSHLFAVADDENNVLRIYDADKGGLPLHAVDVSSELQLHKKKNREADLEAATRVGDTALWLSSHARTKKGKLHPDRFKLFMTNLPRLGAPIAFVGPVYTELSADLLADPRLAVFDLQSAAERPPQVLDGFNIEGMTAMDSGVVLLGFRTPVPQGKALLVPLLDPKALFRGKRARFGAAIVIDLGGQGIRGLSRWHGKYLIAAGGHAEGGTARLYQWTGPGAAPSEVKSTSLHDFNPEALFTPEDRDEVLLFSDDGARMIDGRRCKDLDAAQKRFRGLWLRPE